MTKSEVKIGMKVIYNGIVTTIQDINSVSCILGASGVIVWVGPYYDVDGRKYNEKALGSEIKPLSLIQKLKELFI